MSLTLSWCAHPFNLISHTSPMAPRSLSTAIVSIARLHPSKAISTALIRQRSFSRARHSFAMAQYTPERAEEIADNLAGVQSRMEETLRSVSNAQKVNTGVIDLWTRTYPGSLSFVISLIDPVLLVGIIFLSTHRSSWWR